MNDDFQKLIDEAGRLHNVDPALISAAIQAESSWNPNAEGPQTKYGTAKGLGQFIAPTAKSLGIKNPNDPKEAIPAIAKLLAENLDRYGNPEDAVRAYHGGTDKANWGSKTEAHVQKVMSYLNHGNDDELFNKIKKSEKAPEPIATTPEEDALFNQITKPAPETPQNAPAQSESLIGNPMQAAQAFGHHLMNLPHGLANLVEQGVASGVNAIAPDSAVAKYIQNIANQDVLAAQQREQGYQANVPTNTASVLGATAGEVLPAILSGGGNLIEQLGLKGGEAAAKLGLGQGVQGAASLAGKTIGSAGVGGAYSAAQPVVGEGNYWDQIKQNLESGALTGAVMPSIAPALNKAGNATAEALGFTSGVGPTAVKEAYNSGKKGLTEFWDNLSNAVDKGQVVEDAKFNIAKMKDAMSNAYRNGMIDIKNDKTILNFDNVDKALENAKSYGIRHGEVIKESAANAWQKINDAVQHWKTLDPEKFHTPEGFDLLKQKIYDLTEKIPFEEKSGRSVVNNVYNAVKNDISEQAPTYANVMKDYSEGMESLDEIKKALSQGGKASIDTQLRKLQSVMRNNVNTNYGYRQDLVNKLENQEGAKQLMPALAGQAMNTWTPRSLAAQGGALLGLGGMGSAALMGHPEALMGLAALPVESPKLIGMSAYGLGKMASPFEKLSPADANALKLLMLGQASKQPIPRIEISGVPTGQ
jgi:hypothetical protein